MFIGQFLLNGSVMHTLWQPSGGDKAVVSVDVIARSADATLDIVIQHKNLTDADSAATTAASFAQITTLGLAVMEVTGGLKQLVRLALTTGAGGAEDPGSWNIVDVMSPAWCTN